MIVLVVVLPLLAAFLLPLLPGLLRRWIGPLALLAVAGIGAALTATTFTRPVVLAVGDFLPPMGIVFQADAVSSVLVVAVALLSLILWPGRDTPDVDRRRSLNLILAGACAGLAVSGDIFNVYVFYELAAVASYGLVAGDSPAAKVAAFRYVLLSGVGSLLAQIGITLVYFKTGTLNLAHLAELAPHALHNPTGLAAFLLILLGFGVKAELFLVNGWAPEVYATADSRVSGLLAGLVSKLVLIVLVRLLLLAFDVPAAHLIFLGLGMLGMLSGELAAYRARDLRRMLAWSSIGQLGMAFVAFAIPGPAGTAAGLAIALHHLVVKPAMFLLAERWGGSLSGLAGAARKSPLAAGLFVLFALSLLGIPPLPGFWAKYLLLSGLAAQPAGVWWLAGAVVLLATAVEATYLFRVIGALYTRGGEGGAQPAANVARSGVLAATLVAAALSIPLLVAPLERMSVQLADTTAYIARILPTRPVMKP